MLGVHGFPNLILLEKKKSYIKIIYLSQILKRIRIVGRQNCGIHTQIPTDQNSRNQDIKLTLSVCLD